MKHKDITLEDIKTIEKEYLAKLLYDAIQKDVQLYKKVEGVILKNNPKSLYQQINKRINSISRGRKFIEYRKSFVVAKEISDIVDDIKNLMSDKKLALILLKKLILTDKKLFSRCDDSSGSVQDSYQDAQISWREYAPKYLDNSKLIEELKEILICDSYGMRTVVDESFPNDVLRELFDIVLDKY